MPHMVREPCRDDSREDPGSRPLTIAISAHLEANGHGVFFHGRFWSARDYLSSRCACYADLHDAVIQVAGRGAKAVLILLDFVEIGVRICRLITS